MEEEDSSETTPTPIPTRTKACNWTVLNTHISNMKNSTGSRSVASWKYAPPAGLVADVRQQGSPRSFAS